MKMVCEAVGEAGLHGVGGRKCLLDWGGGGRQPRPPFSGRRGPPYSASAAEDRSARGWLAVL